MSKLNKTKQLRASLLDRLFDDNPHESIDQDKDRYQQLKDLRNSVRRDLEDLLNTRYRVVAPDANCEQLQNSLANFGLPDLATVNIIDFEKKKVFSRELENILRKFEPRFKTVRVEFVKNSDEIDRTLRFRLNATLYADPKPEIVVYDSILEPISRTLSVEESQHG